MSFNGALLKIEPNKKLCFPFEPWKQISCSVRVTNVTDNHVAIKVKTTNPKHYCVRPNKAVVPPRSTIHVEIKAQAQKYMPVDCKDKFLFESLLVAHNKIFSTNEMFNKESKKVVRDKMTVVYVQQSPEGSWKSCLTNNELELVTVATNKPSVISTKMAANFFMHPEHPLSNFCNSHGTMKGAWSSCRCDACGDPIRKDDCYGCTPCGFYVHDHCFASLQPTVRDMAHPLHILHFMEAMAGYCLVCKKRCVAWRYHCAVCDVHVHKDCIGKSIMHPQDGDELKKISFLDCIHCLKKCA